MTDVIVCGSAGSFPGLGRACSSYLVREPAGSLILDMGNGSLANLQRWIPLSAMTDIFISHGHPDHWADLIGLLQYQMFGDHPPERIRLYTNAPTAAVLTSAIAAYAAHAETFEIIDVAAGATYRAGPFSFEVFPTWHSRPCHGVRVTTREGTVIAYSGDTALCDSVVEGARDADLLISEASWPQPRDDYPAGVHLTGTEAGLLAHKADARRLLVSHVWPDFDAADSAAAAARAYGGPILVAEDNMTIVVPDGLA